MILPVVVLAFWIFWNRPAKVLRSLQARIAMPSDSGPLLKMVDELARKVRVKKPRVYLVSEFSPNILVLSSFRSPMTLVISDGFLRALNEEELRSMILLALCQGSIAGRALHTRMAAAFFPLTKRMQTLPVVFQFFLAPLFCSLFFLFTQESKTRRGDSLASQHLEGWKIAAALQRLAVLGRKITWKRWDLSLDSLYLVSPLLLEGGPLTSFVPQPTVEQRRANLLQSSACETASSLT